MNLANKKFTLIVGPPACGKMTVAQALSKMSGAPVFHNHLSIEFCLQLTYWGSPIFKQVNGGIRKLVFDAFATNGDETGLIFTLVWAFDLQEDWDYVAALEKKFTDIGWEFWIVELSADLETRLLRNKSENRLNHKQSKRNIQLSEENLLHTDANHQCNSQGLLKGRKNYLLFKNDDLTPENVAQSIINAWSNDGIE